MAQPLDQLFEIFREIIVIRMRFVYAEQYAVDHRHLFGERPEIGRAAFGRERGKLGFGIPVILADEFRVFHGAGEIFLAVKRRRVVRPFRLERYVGRRRIAFPRQPGQSFSVIPAAEFIFRLHGRRQRQRPSLFDRRRRFLLHRSAVEIESYGVSIFRFSPPVAGGKYRGRHDERKQYSQDFTMRHLFSPFTN